MLSALKTKLTALRAAPTDLNGLLDRIDDLRETIASHQAEREAVSRAPRPASEILEALDFHLDKIATQSVDALHLGRITRRDVPTVLELPFRLDRDTRQVDATAALQAVFGLLIACNREAFRSLIAGQINDLCRGRPALTDADQASRLAALDQEILIAEMAEERSIRDLEAAGVAVLRRPDASPLAALAADDALPS